MGEVDPTEGRVDQEGVLASQAAVAADRPDLLNCVRCLLLRYRGGKDDAQRVLLSLRHVTALALGAPAPLPDVSKEETITQTDILIGRTFRRACADAAVLGTVNIFQSLTRGPELREAVLSVAHSYRKNEWSQRVAVIGLGSPMEEAIRLDNAIMDEDGELTGFSAAANRFIKRSRRSPEHTSTSDLVRRLWLPLCLWAVEAMDRAPLAHDAATSLPGFKSLSLGQTRKAINNASRSGLYKSLTPKAYRGPDGALLLRD